MMRARKVAGAMEMDDGTVSRAMENQRAGGWIGSRRQRLRATAG